MVKRKGLERICRGTCGLMVSCLSRRYGRLASAIKNVNSINETWEHEVEHLVRSLLLGDSDWWKASSLKEVLASWSILG